MGVLVTAGTGYGATAEIAQALAQVLGERGLEATVLLLEQSRGRGLWRGGVGSVV